MMTYREIKDIVNKMTDEQLDQMAQIMISQPDHDKPFPLHMVIGLDTVHNYVSCGDDIEVDTTRSAVDNEHHPEQFVLLADWNMFAEDGSMGFDLETGERFYGADKKDVEVEDEFRDTFQP